MKKGTISFSKLAILVVLTFFCNSAFTQSEFAFELINPATNQVSVKSSDEILVEITFNAEAVNKIGAYIATVANGKMIGFSASTTMESPYSTTIPAKKLGEGKHTVEYMLLPAGSQDQSKALAKVAVQIVIEGSLSNSSFDIEYFIKKNLVGSIRANDLGKFETYIISKTEIDNMIQSIDGNSPEVTGFKSELASIDVEGITKELVVSFDKLQKTFSEQNTDVSYMRHQVTLEQEIAFEVPQLKALKMKFVIGNGSSTFVIRVDMLLTEYNAYLVDFDFELGM